MTAEGIIEVNPIKKYSRQESVHYTDLVAIWKPQESEPEYYRRTVSSGVLKVFVLRPLEDIKVEIGEENISVPAALHEIVEHIEEAKELLSYKFDWDEEGAEPTDPETFQNAAIFILESSSKIYKKEKLVLPTPYIDLLRDGSISVHWESTRAKFLIIFRKGGESLAYYYAETKGSRVPFKSAIEVGQPVDEILLAWMQKNLH